ncbi:uncharacterized protein LOC102803618 [Saccoglossus kowalevskii]|uniref:Vacuolar protein 8-like n=1 Tax=Saccoglossus kowalevskii TaxID=10224 RepID=A0ABM0MHZ2_SACKO|nr:PREDICTED: vacuolar protein 8-like [Saccoglossus kowalevskii]
MSASTLKIKVEGKNIFPAQTDGSSNVFGDGEFVLARMRWMEDSEAVMCNLCCNKFNQFRRKHHCRVCGRVTCNKCCKEKVPLPHLGYPDPERVCEECLTVTQLISKSRSHILSFQIEAADGLYKELQDPKGMVQIVQLGGIQTLIYLARLDNIDIRKHTAAGIHILSTNPALHATLAGAGAIKALCSLLRRSQTSEEQTIIDCISALRIFCKSAELKMKAIDDGVLQPVLSLCSAREEIALLVVMILSLIVEHHGTHTAVIENDRNALPRILDLTSSQDEQMQEVALRTLALLSMGTDQHKQRLVQEDYARGKCFTAAVRRKPKNTQVVCNVACLLANLAALPEQNQNALQDYLCCACEMLSEYSSLNNVMGHVSRAIANFAKHQIHTHKLLEHLNTIITLFLKSTTVSIQYQGIRAVLYLLSHSTEITTTALLREGATDVLCGIAHIPGVINAVQAAILLNVPDTDKPNP